MTTIFKVRCKGSHGRCKCSELCEYWTVHRPGFGETLIGELELKENQNPEYVVDVLNGNEHPCAFVSDSIRITPFWCHCPVLNRILQ